MKTKPPKRKNRNTKKPINSKKPVLLHYPPQKITPFIKKIIKKYKPTKHTIKFPKLCKEK